MRVRDLRRSDIEYLRRFHADSGFLYDCPDFESPLLEAALVVVDDADTPVAAALAERIIQLSLLTADLKPVVKMRVIRLLHERMAARLSAKGYHEANCFIPPQIAVKFGRRLERSF